MKDADELIFDDSAAAWNAVASFADSFGDRLPLDVRDAIERFRAINANKIDEIRSGPDFTAKRVFAMKMMSLANEITHGMNDLSEIIRSRAELALRHLQQLIIVDKDVRSKWRAAFANGGETECEKLGGVHLLWHGILAFKAHATGGRTDLVLSEPLNTTNVSAVEGLVLTEWKVGDSADYKRKLTAARKQADKYSATVLGGVELRRYRFLVLVSEKNIRMPNDETIADVTYRHVNIAVNPDNPSKAATSSTT